MIDWPNIPPLWDALDRYEERWKLAYPGVEVQREVLKMAEWLEDHPSRWPKKNWKLFMTRWLARTHGRLLEAQVRQITEREIGRSVARNY